MDIARVLVYDHGELTTKGLGDLARDLLEVIIAEIETTKSTDARPIFFICHSIGGLVLKFALVEASHTPRYTAVLENAYVVTFFATPHEGSKWLSKPAYSESISKLLELSKPLPAKLMAELRPKDATLMSINQDFKVIASGLLIWSFYENQRSTLCGVGSSENTSEVRLSTIFSSVLGVHHENAYFSFATHSNCASFGYQFEVDDYLNRIAEGIHKADRETKDRDLKLKKKVFIEVRNFYESSGLGDNEKDLKGQWLLSEEKSLESFWTGATSASLQTTSTADERDLETERECQTAQKGIAPSTVLSTVASDSSDKGKKELRRILARPLAAFVRRPSKSKDLEMGSSDSVSGASTHPSSDPGIAQAGFSSLQNTSSGPSLSPLPGEHVSSSLSAPLEPLDLPLSSADGSSEKERKREASPKFTWFHLPFNNPAWVEKVFDTFAKGKGWEYPRLPGAKDWLSQHARARRSQPHGYFLKPTCILTPIKDHSAKVDAPGGDQSESTRKCLFLCFLFLQIDSYKAHLQRQNVVRKRMSQGCSWPIPEDVFRDDAPLENKVIWDFLDHYTPLNCRRTLDQYRYPFVRDTRARDDDQMLYKMTKEMVYALSDDSDDEAQEEERGGEIDRYYESLGGEKTADNSILDGNILNVDQLWLWTNDDGKYPGT